MDWKTLAEKENAKAYVLPKGWDSRDTVALQLDCSPDRVDDHLRPALKSGKVQKQQFRVWDDRLKKPVMVVAYAAATVRKEESEDLTAKLVALKKEGKSYAEIGAIVGLSGDAVRGKLRRVA